MDETKYFFLLASFARRMSVRDAMEAVREAGRSLGATVESDPFVEPIEAAAAFLASVFACDILDVSRREVRVRMRKLKLPKHIAAGIDMVFVQRLGCEYASAVLCGVMTQLQQKGEMTWKVHEDVMTFNVHNEELCVRF